ncbi:MAG: hypothetical protein Q7W51_02705 [Coriobacteriia bacterium]|nr:hypothetical protein [Coriobacteriia bacterium]
MFAGPCDDWIESSSSYQAALEEALAAGRAAEAESIAQMIAHYARTFTITWMLRLAPEFRLEHLVDSQTCSDTVFDGITVPDASGPVTAIHMLSLVVDQRLITAISPAWESEDGVIHPLVTYDEARQAAIEQVIVPMMNNEPEYRLHQGHGVT